MDAAKEFIEVERQHPYSKWAKKGMIMSAYALFLDEEYVNAVSAIDRFLALHPADDEVPYMLYLKSLCFYDQMSAVDREQKITYKALAAMQELVARFGNSKYAKDVRNKILIAKNHLAAKEMYIGREMLRDGNYAGAINRFQNVVKEFDTTLQIEEALYRLTESYVALGLVDQAKKPAAVLRYNYPNSKWYQKAYKLIKKYS